MEDSIKNITRVIPEEEDGWTVRRVMRKSLYFSARAVSRICRRETGILLNGERVYTDRILHTGDLLRVEIGDKPKNKENIKPGDWPLKIVWEDDYFMIIDKPAGMTAHASNFSPDSPTVAGALAWTRGTDFIFHPVNRLDKGTTGLMVVAKNGYIHDRLRKGHHTRRFYREYRAICVNSPEPPSGTIYAPIGRDENSTIARMIRHDGANAVTRYEVLKNFKINNNLNNNINCAFLKLTPLTGRTHQLRLHMAHWDCPLLGDWLYGDEAPDLISRPALHSYFLSVQHPVTGEILNFTAPIPDDMTSLIGKNIDKI